MLLKTFQKFLNVNCKYVIIILLIISLTFYKRHYLRLLLSSTCESATPRLNDAKLFAKNHFLICMDEAARIFHNYSTRFFEEFRHCIKTHIAIDESQMDNLSNDVFGEKKMFLPFSFDYPQRRCKWLTIGIGGVITAEKLLKEKYPECQIFGVEPTNPGNFSTVGKLIPFGVGMENTEMELIVNEDGFYNQKSVKVLSLTHLMDEHLESRFAHYLTIDIEGYEYKVLEELVGEGKFAKSEITFCQIDAELHYPKFPKAHPDISDLNAVEFITNFLKNSSPYLPIFNVPYLRHPHQKVTFINIQNEECENAFNFSNYFEN